MVLALSGVVVIEELESFKRILESDSEPIVEKIRILNKLHEKNPSKEVLVEVGIGKTVNNLRRGQEAVLLLGGVDSVLPVLSLSLKFDLSRTSASLPQQASSPAGHVSASPWPSPFKPGGHQEL